MSATLAGAVVGAAVVGLTTVALIGWASSGGGTTGRSVLLAVGAVPFSCGSLGLPAGAVACGKTEEQAPVFERLGKLGQVADLTAYSDPNRPSYCHGPCPGESFLFAVTVGEQDFTVFQKAQLVMVMGPG